MHIVLCASRCCALDPGASCLLNSWRVQCMCARVHDPSEYKPAEDFQQFCNAIEVLSFIYEPEDQTKALLDAATAHTLTTAVAIGQTESLSCTMSRACMKVVSVHKYPFKPRLKFASVTLSSVLVRFAQL